MQIAIKEIRPGTFDNGFIRGIVSLRWPYSSSQHALSIQISEEDIRKRSDRGQVRLTFHGAAADALKDLPSLCILEVSAPTGSADFTEVEGTIRDVKYRISFTGDVHVKKSDGKAMKLDSRKVVDSATPRKTRRTWLTPDLKRTAPTDELGLEETWFSQPSPSLKKSRYSSSFRFVDSTTTTPTQPRGTQEFPDENNLGIHATSIAGRPQDTAKKSPYSIVPTTSHKPEMFEFQTPVAPVRFETTPSSQPEIVSNMPEESLTTSLPIVGQNASTTQPVEVSTSNVPASNVQDEPQVDEPASRASSLHGDSTFSTYDQGTPRTGPQVHFNILNQESAPPTPRNVPFMSLESAHEQEDFYRKLRASAPPKSDAGSSMVADEDDEAGNLARDPDPTILETQSRVQEGILRSKISDETDEQRVRLNPDSPGADDEQLAISKPGQSDAGRDSTYTVDDANDGTFARSTIAAYGNSLDGHESTVTADVQQIRDQSRSRGKSPSMSERGAAVQESVFRSKIRSSDNDSDADNQMAESVKSSVLVEPAAASVDGSIHENIERTMLDQQASVQETLFRQKLDRDEAANPERTGNLSLIGQAHAASSNAGDEVINEEPSMLQQQNSIQENIFRDKVDLNGQGDVLHTAPASLDHMNANDTAHLTDLVHDQTTRSGQTASNRQESLDGADAAAGSSNAAPSVTVVEAFHLKADVETAIGAAVGDVESEQEAQDFLRMELEAEPEERLDHDRADNLDTAENASDSELSFTNPGSGQIASDLFVSTKTTEIQRCLDEDQPENLPVDLTTNRIVDTNRNVHERGADIANEEAGQDTSDDQAFRTQQIPAFHDDAASVMSNGSPRVVSLDEPLASVEDPVEQYSEHSATSTDSNEASDDGTQGLTAHLATEQELSPAEANNLQDLDSGKDGHENATSVSISPQIDHLQSPATRPIHHSPLIEDNHSYLDESSQDSEEDKSVYDAAMNRAEATMLEPIEILSSSDSDAEQVDDSAQSFPNEGNEEEDEELMLDVESEPEYSENLEEELPVSSDKDQSVSDDDKKEKEETEEIEEVEENEENETRSVQGSSLQGRETSPTSAQGGTKPDIQSEAEADTSITEDPVLDNPADDLLTEVNLHE